MSLQDVAACISVIRFFIDKAAAMKSSWAEAAALMERCALCKPLLDQITANQLDERYLASKLALCTAAAEPCLVVLRALLEQIQSFVEEFTQRTWTAGFKRFAFTKSKVQQLAAFET